MNEISNASNLEYFAAVEDPDRLGALILEKVRIFREWYSPITSLQVRKLANYYGRGVGGNSSQSVTRGGAEGELAMIKINDLRQLIQEQLVIVTGQRPAGVARAINSDTDSLKAAKIGTAISEFYMSEVGFEQKFVNAAEIALLCDESFIENHWDKTAGDPIAVDPQTQQPEMSGDAGIKVHCPWNAARDPGLPWGNQCWIIFTSRVNKFDAAAKYPKFEQQIISGQNDGLMMLPMDKIPDESDAVFEHLLIHDRTAAVPNGRYTIVINGQVVLDSGLPFKDYPVSRMTPADVIDACLGYSAANDILAAEEVTDALHSVITTNEVTLGGATIVGPIGANLNFTDFGKGMRYFELPPDMVDKLRTLDFVRTAPEIFNYIQVLGGKKERAVGSVSSSLAAQASQGASGSSMALIQSQSISFNSGTQRSYFRLLSDVMTKNLGVIRSYADTPRVARIVGLSKSAGLKEFKYTGQDLNSISTIVYEIVNPIAQTYGGRLTFAQDLIKAGMIKNPKQYITVATTGQVDAMTENDEADQILILEENEWLNENKPFQAVITQMHAEHIKAHTSVITLDAQASDPDFVARTLSHIQQHVDLWQQASMSNPGILMATGQQPLMPPPPPPGMMPPGGPGAPPPGAPQGPGQMAQPGSPAQKTAEGVRPPNLPNIAGTQQKPTIPGVTNAPN